MRHVLILLLIALSAALTPALAAPATIEGSWRGSGIVGHRGSADAVRCRVRFTRATPSSFGVSAQCATDTGRYDVSGRVVSKGGNRYSGWVTTNDQGGLAVILQHGNRLSVTVKSRRGSAKLSLSRG